MNNEEAKEIKQQCKEDILQALKNKLYLDKLTNIDSRLVDYIQDSADKNTDHANLYELLGIRKFLRMLCTYPFNFEKVHMVYKAYEHLRFSGLNGKQQYKLTPMQTFQLAAPFGFMRSEEDWRRICTEANYFVPRKSSKTTLAAFFIFWFFFFEDFNSESYCTANSSDQSKILFRLASDLIRQMDPEGKHIRFTATEVSWYNSNERESKVAALSAGGKTKDGLFAQLCCSDEYGSAGYVKGHSDMANLVNVVEGSMGPRKEPLTVHTTTAGRIVEGPYEIKLRGIKEQLLLEMDIPLDGKPHPKIDDWQFALICCPDQWEESDEDLQRPEVWRKVNRHIGITVQPDFYEREWVRMLQDPEKKKEQITKLFNVWQSNKVTQWLKGDRIRPLQRERRITDCKYEDGWNIFVGMDFSHGDDLFAITYLAVNYRPEHPQAGRFFVDTDAWVLESTMLESPNRQLYEAWHAGGWIHICPGEVFNSAYAINTLAEKIKHGLNLVIFGYDPAQSIQPINNLKAWLQTLGIDPQTVMQMVVPVGQTALTQNPRIAELEDMIKSPEQWMEFSNNPIWPWAFCNCAVELNSSDLRRIVKGGPAATAKIDPVAALVDALYCFDLSEGRIQ
jgi:phage terminase large subunit-like protein